MLKVTSISTIFIIKFSFYSSYIFFHIIFIFIITSNFHRKLSTILTPSPSHSSLLSLKIPKNHPRTRGSPNFPLNHDQFDDIIAEKCTKVVSHSLEWKETGRRPGEAARAESPFWQDAAWHVLPSMKIAIFRQIIPIRETRKARNRRQWYNVTRQLAIGRTAKGLPIDSLHHHYGCPFGFLFL